MKYREKPVTIEAVQFIDEDYGNLCAIGNLGVKPTVLHNPLRLEFGSPERRVTVKLYDYIIKEANGEFCTCTPAEFNEKYEPYYF